MQGDTKVNAIIIIDRHKQQRGRERESVCLSRSLVTPAQEVPNHTGRERESEGYSKGLYIMVNNYFLNRQVNNKGPSNTAHMSFDITKHNTHSFIHTDRHVDTCKYKETG